MAKSIKKPAAKSGNHPDFIAYAVVNRADVEAKARWREIGTAWLHNDGNGLQLRLDALPVDGVVTLRAPLPPKSDA
jgi:hypothetical protein